MIILIKADIHTTWYQKWGSLVKERWVVCSYNLLNLLTLSDRTNGPSRARGSNSSGSPQDYKLQGQLVPSGMLLYCLSKEAEDVLKSTNVRDDERKVYETVFEKFNAFSK